MDVQMMDAEEDCDDYGAEDEAEDNEQMMQQMQAMQASE
jgi:hypothetical protein